jgi:hypothetical protein
VRTAELPRVHKGRESVKLSLGLTPESFPKKRGSDRSNPLKPYLVARVPTHAQSENVQSNSKKKKKSSSLSHFCLMCFGRKKNRTDSVMF